MANFLFWLFMLATALLIPACMLYFGHRFQTRPPRSINMGYGYRSTRSMRSQEAWDFAQVTAGGSGFGLADQPWRSHWSGCSCSLAGTSARWASPLWS